MTYNTIIVEDEHLLSNVIKSYLEQFDEIKCIGVFDNAMSAFNFLQTNNVDLIFLDIEMPLINGIEFAKKLDSNSEIIFTTAYSEYAIKGFDLNALDYLLKPIKFDRFYDAIQKFLKKQQHSIPASLNNTITIKTDGVYHKINLDDLIYIESLKEYIRYYTADNKYLIYGSLSKVSEQLKENNFIRIHKSYTCALNHIKSVKYNELELSNGIILPIGRTYKNDVLSHFK